MRRARQPTPRDESAKRRRPRGSGGRLPWIPAPRLRGNKLRGNDVNCKSEILGPRLLGASCAFHLKSEILDLRFPGAARRHLEPHPPVPPQRSGEQVARTAGFAVRGSSTGPRKSRGPQARPVALPPGVIRQASLSQGDGRQAGRRLWACPPKRLRRQAAGRRSAL